MKSDDHHLSDIKNRIDKRNSLIHDRFPLVVGILMIVFILGISGYYKKNLLFSCKNTNHLSECPNSNSLLLSENISSPNLDLERHTLPHVKIYVSSLEGDRLTVKEHIDFVSKKSDLKNIIQIDETQTFQIIEGFGASFNEAGMICLNSLNNRKADSVLQCLFDSINGAGFSLMKTPLAACDFSSAGPWYSYNDTPGDIEMKNFSIERDLGPNGLVKYIKRAQQFGRFTLHSTMDFPPDWMLVSLKKGEKHIKPEYYNALAKYFSLYIQAYRSEGINIDFLSPLNEPDNGWYTNVTYEAIRNITLNHIIPLFRKENISTRIQLGETVTRSEGLKKIPAVLDDYEFRKSISTITVHGYDWNRFDAIAELHKKYPDIPIWMSEVCYAQESNIPPHGPKKVPVYDFSDGQFWGNMIMNDIKSGASGWIYWNMILDEKGGPWLVSKEHGDPENNAQHPVVIINRKSGEVCFTGLYYYLSHFSRFVRPGAYRIQATGNHEKLNFTAFMNPDGKKIVVVINNDKKTDGSIQWNSYELNFTFPAHSVTTFIW